MSSELLGRSCYLGLLLAQSSPDLTGSRIGTELAYIGQPLLIAPVSSMFVAARMFPAPGVVFTVSRTRDVASPADAKSHQALFVPCGTCATLPSRRALPAVADHRPARSPLDYFGQHRGSFRRVAIAWVWDSVYQDQSTRSSTPRNDRHEQPASDGRARMSGFQFLAGLPTRFTRSS